MALFPVDPKYVDDLQGLDEEVYGPGAYEWNGVFEHVTVMMYSGGMGFVSYKLEHKNQKPQAVVIEKLAVQPGARRLGIGTEILQWVIERARKNKIRWVDITIPLDHFAAAHFLAHNGFESKLMPHDFILFRRAVILI